MTDRIGFIGFGEVTACLLKGMTADGYEGPAFVCAAHPDAARERAKAFSCVTVCDSVSALLSETENVIVAVPGKADKAMFEGIAKGDLAGRFFMDISTALPNEKKEIAATVAAGGGGYVDAAVMGSVPKLLQKTPIMISGPNASKMLDLLEKYGFSLEVCGDEVGVASTVKLCRSIFMKGLPALYLEAKRTCEHYGVAERVFASVERNLTGQNMQSFLTILLNGAYKHTERQTDELRECLEMEKDAGVDPKMTEAAIRVFESIREEKNR